MKNNLERIKIAINKAQKKGLVYYPCNDKELLEEWGDDANKMNDEKLEYHIEINSICGGEW